MIKKLSSHPTSLEEESKNFIINGGFDVWQRSTSYTWTATGTYGAADRWLYWHNGSTVGTNVSSRQSFTPGTAPVAGYEGAFFHRITTTTLGTGQNVVDLWQRIEDVRTLSGSTITVSFWVKSSGSFGFVTSLDQNFGSGGSTSVTTSGASGTTSTSWTRYTSTINIPSVSGKTIGANSYLVLVIRFLAPTAGATFDVWGVQVENGPYASRFEELSFEQTIHKCQRYYQKMEVDTIGDHFGSGFNKLATVGMFFVPFEIQMRTAPTSLEHSGTAGHYSIAHANTSTTASVVPSFESATVNGASVNITVASGLTAGQGSIARAASTSAYLAFSAEL